MPDVVCVTNTCTVVEGEVRKVTEKTELYRTSPMAGGAVVGETVIGTEKNQEDVFFFLFFYIILSIFFLFFSLLVNTHTYLCVAYIVINSIVWKISLVVSNQIYTHTHTHPSRKTKGDRGRLKKKKESLVNKGVYLCILLYIYICTNNKYITDKSDKL